MGPGAAWESGQATPGLELQETLVLIFKCLVEFTPELSGPELFCSGGGGSPTQSPHSLECSLGILNVSRNLFNLVI